MPQFYLAFSIGETGGPLLPAKLRPGHTARLLFHRARDSRRCALHELIPGGARERRSVAGIQAEDGAGAQNEQVFPLGTAEDVVINFGPDSATITVPLSSLRHVYYRRDGNALWVSDDVRLLVRPGMSLDIRGLLCHLELVAPIAPFVFWRDIRRVPPGTALTINLEDLSVRETAAPFFKDPGDPSLRVEPSDAMRVSRIGELLDSAIRQSSPQRRGIVLFSGGVDSGLLAARAAEMGWRDVVLAHSTRGPDDRETRLARDMAGVLKLPFHSFPYRPDDAMAELPDMFDAYQTVNDYSMMPTSVLARQIVDAFPNEDIVWNGTNADALFGGLERWRKARLIYGAPALLRSGAGWIYRAGRFWARPTTRWENYLCVLRRTALWPYPSFTLALHPMGEILYHAPQAVRREIAHSVHAWLDMVAAALPPRVRPKILTVTINACGKGCLKPAAVFENAGMVARFPFLERDLVTFALQAATTWPAHLREGKSALKELLTRSVPREMVYRPKSGFIIPAAETFGHRMFLNAFAEVIESSSGPFASLLKAEVARSIYAAMERREPLAWYTYEAVWSLVFGHHWIARIEENATSGLQDAAASNVLR